VWLSILGIALLCTALAYIVYFRLLAAAGATNLLLVTFLLPVNSLLLGWFVLRETVPPSAFGGMALIGLGLAAIDGRPARRIWPLLSAALCCLGSVERKRWRPASGRRQS
jgi:drug/metabolite transporter (DMT)-like permease